MSAAPRICLLGLGEVGQALAEDLRARGLRLTTWDIQFSDARSKPVRAAERLTLPLPPDVRAAVSDAELVVSAVTAAQCVTAAQSVAPHLRAGAWYFDLNSVSPGSRVAAADVVTQAGGRYVEAAVMSPIHPQRSASHMLLGGPHAQAFAPLAGTLGFTGAQVYAAHYGAASAAKMCRSVVVKGLEALMLESLLAARHFGVESTVVESLRGWLGRDAGDGFAQYLLSRALIHGRRRAEEMREVARTVSEAGLAPRMSEACAQWQDWAAGRIDQPQESPLPALLDELRAQARREVA